MNIEESKHLNKTALKSGSSYMLSNILLNATTIITAPILTRLLTTSDYGIASNFMAWQNIGLVVIGLGLSYSIGNAKTDFPSELNKYLASIQTLGSILAATTLIIAIIFKRQLSEFMEIDQNLVVSIFVYLLFLPSVIYSQEKYKFRLQYKENIFISVFNTFGSIICCLIFILYLFNDQRYYGRIFGLIFPLLILGVFFYIKILRNGWTKNISKYWSYALKISLPLIPHTLGMVVLTQIDRIMIIKICGNSDAGLYSFGFSYAILLALFSGAVSQAYQPWLYINYNNNALQSIKKSSNIITSGMCILTLIIITMAPEAIKILGARDFWDAKWVVMPIAIGALFQYLASTYTTLELYHKKTMVIPVGTLLAAIINFCLNSLLIPIFGYIAAAFSTLISFLFLALFHLVVHKKVTKKSVYDDKYIWTVAIITTMVSFLIIQLYEYFFLRYFVLIVILLIIGSSQKKKAIAVYELVFSKKSDSDI